MTDKLIRPSDFILNYNLEMLGHGFYEHRKTWVRPSQPPRTQSGALIFKVKTKTLHYKAAYLY